MTARTPPQLSPQSTLGERFGHNLWCSRRRADLSQEKLANLVGLSRQAIYALEGGRRLPRLDTIVKLAAGTNVSVSFLLEGMEWRPGRYVDGDFYVEHPPPPHLRRGRTGS
jgi:DNA-binding XRE family transcriptional regulator